MAARPVSKPSERLFPEQIEPANAPVPTEGSFTVTQIYPPNAAHDVAPNTVVSASFSLPVDFSTVSTRTFTVRGQQMGDYGGTYVTTTGGVLFDADQDFRPGEEILVHLSDGLQAQDGTPLTPYAWGFRAAALAGTGIFADSLQRLSFLNSVDLALGDLDGDGDLDAFVANLGGNKVWLNDGTGTFIDSGQNLGNSSSEGVALGDLDGDSDLDAFVSNVNQEPNKVWLNDGTGTFVDSGQSLGNSYSIEPALGDLDGDGDLDAYVANYTWTGTPNKVWLNDGSGTFVDSGQSLGNRKSQAVALGDVDGDGDLDALTGNADAAAEPSNRLWLNDGSANFTDSGQSLDTRNTQGVALGDLDGDGDLDVFNANFSGGDTVWLNNGTGTFSDSGQGLASSDSRAVTLGDVDGDGDLDVYVVSDYPGPNTLWLNSGAGIFGDSGQSMGNAFSWGVDMGDVDGDGDLDAWIANRSTQPNEVWLNQNLLRLVPRAQWGYAHPGGGVCYEARLVNSTGRTDSFLLAFSGNAWSTTLSITETGALEPADWISFTVQVSVPLVASPGDSDVLVLTATSVTSPSVVSDPVHITTVAQDCYARLNDEPTDYTSVQSAVDAAEPGDLVKVAGYCLDIHGRSAPPGYNGPVLITQVVYLTKTLTIQGGYTVTNWTDPDPLANPTTLDARGEGRVLFIGGDVSPTIAGLHLTGGDAAGLRGKPTYAGSDAGGGIYVLNAAATISGNEVLSNTAQVGGGLLLCDSLAAVRGNIFISNTATADGGGLYLGNSPAVLSDNTILSNTAALGGGLFLWNSPATLRGNDVAFNEAMEDGGGLRLRSSDANVEGNTFTANDAADDGGGLFLDGSGGTLSGNIITANSAVDNGGGLYLEGSNAVLSGNTTSGNSASDGGGLYLNGSPATLDNNTISDNSAGSGGGGLYLNGSPATLVGNTLSDNAASAGAGAYLQGAAPLLRGNTFMANQATVQGGGLYLGGSDATLINNLVADNRAAVAGDGLVIVDASPRLLHTTVAGHRGVGVHIAGFSTVALTNTILVGHGVGITVTAGSQVSLEGTLWGSGSWANGQDWAGEGNIITGTVNLWRDPAFVDPANGDYHIGPKSAAEDAGVDSGVGSDMDEDVRPSAFGYDLGADERPGAGLRMDLSAWPLVLERGQVVTYTIAISSAGADPVYDTWFADPLPGSQRGLGIAASRGSCALEGNWGGTATCDLGTMPPGDVVRVTLTAEVSTTPQFPAPWRVRNSAWVTATEAANSAHVDIWLHDCHVRLNDDPTTYSSVQAAVGASTDPADVVKVAGSCIGVEYRAGVTQSVYLSKTLTIQGGYEATFSEPPDPLAYPTTLDAAAGAYGQGRVLYVAGAISPTIAGLRLTGGDVAGLGEDGGGIYVLSATATFSNNQVFGNRARQGGGLALYASAALIQENTFTANVASDGGGALYLQSSPATLNGNTITANAAGSDGGGLYAEGDPVTLIGNTISANSARLGGGLASYYQVTLVGNTITANRAAQGGGLYLGPDDPTTLTNDVLADNQASGGGSALYLSAAYADLRHTTIARNRGSSGIYLDFVFGGDWEVFPSVIILSNTILVSHTVGIQLEYYCEAFLEATLWGSGAWGNGQDWIVYPDATTFVTGTINLWEEPGFLDPAAGDYHIGPGSGAIDTGVDAGVTTDIDGDPRPVGPGYDIGADELLPITLNLIKLASPDPVPTGVPLTYTLQATNTGMVTLTATITDTLPAQVTPTGVLSWTAQIVPGDVWTETVVVTVDLDYVGLLANVVQVSTVEGAAGAYTCTATVVDEPIAGLAATNDGPTVLGDPTTLSATVTAGTNVSFTWDLGDGSFDNGAVVSHTYTATGVYTPAVTASNSVSLLTATTVVTVTEGPKTHVVALLAFDNDLAPYAEEVVERFRLGTTVRPGLQATLLLDGKEDGDSQVVEVAGGVVTYTGSIPWLPGVDEVDTASPEVIAAFLTWARGAHDATRAVVALVGHGVGPAPEIHLPAGEGQGIGSQLPPLPQFRDRTPIDVTSGTYLSTPELGRALQAATGDGTAPFDLLFLDQCFEGSLDVLYEIRSAAQVLVASPNYAWALFAYDRYLPHLGPEVPVEEMAQAIVAEYEAGLDDEHPNAIVWVRGTDLAAIGGATNALGDALQEELGAGNEGTILAAALAGQYVDTTLCAGDLALCPPDELLGLGSFAGELRARFPEDSPVYAAAGEVLAQLDNVTGLYRVGHPWVKPEAWWAYSDTLTVLAPLTPTLTAETVWRASIYTETVPLAVLWPPQPTWTLQITTPLALAAEGRWDALAGAWYGPLTPTVGQLCHDMPPALVVLGQGYISLTVEPGLVGALLEWTAATHPDAFNYGLYLLRPGGGAWELLDIVPLEQTSYLHTEPRLPSGTYTYLVAARDVQGHALALSDEVGVEVGISGLAPGWGYNDVHTYVQVSGTGFQAPLTVTLGGVVLGMQTIERDLLGVVVPAGFAPGLYDLAVVVTQGQAVAREAYRVVAPPEVQWEIFLPLVFGMSVDW